MGWISAAAIWAAVVLLAALAGMRLGYSGPRFAIALAVAAALFASDFFLALPKLRAAVQGFLGHYGVALPALVPLFAVLVYAAGVGGNWKYTLAGAGYAALPALVLAISRGGPPGNYGDYAAFLLIWLPVEFRLLYRLFPYPPQLTHTLTILLALSTGVAAFVLLRALMESGMRSNGKAARA